ncbi:MAG: FAD:protein FMN transferase [Halioglobus sp.]
MILVVNVISKYLGSHSREWLFYFLLVAGLGGCGGAIEPVKLAGDTMGTTWHVTYIAAPDGPAQNQLRDGIQGQLDAVNSSMSTYQPDSEISRFSALQTNTWFKVSPEFFQVLTTALDIGAKSEGAYDVTVAPLVNLWGFGPTKTQDEPPGQDTIEEVKRHLGQGNIRVDRDRLSIMKVSDLSLDFSSLAKGYAVDRVAQWLLEQGVQRFVVEVGGEMRLAGLSGRGDPWHIAIERPDASGRAVAATMEVTNVAIATSGDYRNYFEANGHHYSHIIDPRTGYPVAHDLVSVTVVNASCMVADAWATALTVLGPERAMAVAQAQGLAVYFIRKAGDEFVHSHTPAFSPYLPQTQP